MREKKKEKKKKLECPLVSQICTLWKLRFHQEFFIFYLINSPCGARNIE